MGKNAKIKAARRAARMIGLELITPEWRDRLADAVHAGVEATTVGADQGCLRYALVGAEVLRSALPALGVDVERTAVNIGSLFVEHDPASDVRFAMIAEDGGLQRGEFHAIAVATTGLGPLGVDFAARHYPAWMGRYGFTWRQPFPCRTSVWMISGQPPDWWRFTPDREQTARLLTQLPAQRDELAAVAYGAEVARSTF